MLALFVFTAAFSAFFLVRGVVLMNVHLIIGGFAFTAVSIPMILTCWYSHRCSDDDSADKPTDRDQLR